MKAVKLYFKTPLRAGGANFESSSEIIHSDTLFSAIANALAALNEDVEEFIERVKAGETEISSCFPFNGEEYYFPAPAFPVERKLGQFLTREDFEKTIGGELPEDGEKVLDFLKKYDVPKVALDRATSNSNVYYLSLVRFKENSGLYFLVRGKYRQIKVALRYLEDEGIGGKRTWGLGKFKFEEDELNLRVTGDEYLTLSLTHPFRRDSILYWKPVIRSGWIDSYLRKPKIAMASEGSVFSTEDPGNLIELGEYTSMRPDHEVYVNGKSFLIPVKVIE